ncbi:MAG TPA: class I tRNA ligase family protein, partial [Candidatus Kapabacteria bacterium]|nr:class I tRNA ligase family protein [Candidatus Kapabacteria bacterium]
NYTHSVGYSERGGEMVEPYLSDQWFVSMKQLAAPALQVVEDGTIKFYPERWTNTYRHWMTNIRDWCISRQLWWGHRIPAWYAETGEIFVGRNEEEARAKAKVAGYNGALVQDPDVLDTWFSSWLWPFATFGWPEANPDLIEFYPTSLLVTGFEIIFFWVARMIMAGIEFMPSIPLKDGSPRVELKDRIPFREVYFHNIIRDLEGRKMSKSLGNSPDPLDLIANYGTDALRFTLLYLAPMGQDIRFGEQSCEFGRNFANKLWNATRFILMKREEYHKTHPKTEFESEDTELLESHAKRGSGIGHRVSGKQFEAPSNLADKWILSRANRAARDVRAAFDKYEINEVTKILYDFVWRDYCDWYLEIVKFQPDSIPLAVEILEGILRLLHPIIPFVTEELWHALTGEPESVLLGRDDYITADEGKIDREAEIAFQMVQDTVDAIRLIRSTLKLVPSKNAEIIIQARGMNELIVHTGPTPGKVILDFLQPARGIIERLGNASTLQFEEESIDYSSREYACEIRERVRVFVKIEERSIEERAKERDRLAKELARVSLLHAQGKAKFENESFRKRAPLEILKKEEDKLVNYASQIEQLNASIRELA